MTDYTKTTPGSTHVPAMARALANAVTRDNGGSAGWRVIDLVREGTHARTGHMPLPHKARAAFLSMASLDRP